MLGRKERYKIKRYRTIYPQHSPLKSALKVLLVCCVIAALGWVGWIAYEPVGEYLKNRGQAAQSSSESVSEVQEIVSQPQEPEEPAPAAPAVPETVRGVYVPAAMLGDEIAFGGFLDKLSNTDVNTVVFDVKDNAGKVLYASGQPMVGNAEAQSDTAYDLRAAVKLLKDRGLTPIARMQCFADTTAPGRLENSGVTYMNTDMLWLDDAPEKGGKPWLNPYSNVAQAYLLDIAAEVASTGVKHLILDSVTFPVGVGLTYASFGDNAARYSRAEALTGFVKLVEERIAPLGCTVGIMVRGRDALGENDQYYGTNPLSISSALTLDVSPAGLTQSTTEWLPENPVTEPYKAVKALLEGISTDVGGKTLIAMVQAYTATGNLPSNQVYGRAEVQEQVRALSDSGVTGYVFYHPDGNYDTLFS